MSKNIKEWLYAFSILISILGVFLLYIILSREIESKIVLVSNINQKFIKNFTAPNGCDLNLEMMSHNSEIKGIIVLKEQNKIIFQKKIDSIIQKPRLSYNMNQQKLIYNLIPMGILKQNKKYTLLGKFVKIPKNTYLYLKYNRSSIGSFFCSYGLNWFRVKL